MQPTNGSGGGDLTQQQQQQQQQWLAMQQFQQQQWLAMQQYPAAAASMGMHHPAMMYQQPPPHYMPYHYQQQQYQQQQSQQSQKGNQIQTSSEDNKTIWVGDLQHWMDEAYLQSCFAQTGEVRVLTFYSAFFPLLCNVDSLFSEYVLLSFVECILCELKSQEYNSVAGRDLDLFFSFQKKPFSPCQN